MSKGLVTVFGGSGFIGTYVVRALVKDGWRVRVALRRPHTGQDLKVIGHVGQVQLVQANVRYPLSVERAVAGSDAVINLVAVLFNHGNQNFHSLHVQGAKNVAAAAANAGISNYVHMSSLGADENADSEYSRSRADGEALVRAAMPSADIMRPSFVFGPEDDLFNRFAAMSLYTPIMPVIGGGHMRAQPVYVGDIARAVAAIINAGSSSQTYELGGPEIYTLKEIMAYTLSAIDRKRILMPLPWLLSQVMGTVGQVMGALPFINPPITRDQVNSLKSDNLVNADMPGFADLGIDRLETVEAIVPAYLKRFQLHGQFHERSS